MAPIQGTASERFRNQLVAEGIMALRDGMGVFPVTTWSPAQAWPPWHWLVVRANGWIAWKNPNGKTLDEVKPQSVKITD